MKVLSKLKTCDLSGKRVLLRGDLDAPDDFRLRAMKPTIDFLLEGGTSQIIIVGHLGRPEGVIDQKLRLDGIANRLSEIIKQPIKKLDEVLPEVLPNDKIVMLENLRFDPREEANDAEFAERLASYADIYINEAFSVCHRSHASIVGVAKLLPAYAGLQLEKEVETLSLAIKNPARPLVVIIGGVKMETKQPVIARFLSLADVVLVGGKIGLSTMVDNLDGKDIGPKTIQQFVTAIETAKTIIWNGPMGMFEDEKYAAGTRRIAEAIAAASAKTIVGGGDTIAALQQFNLLDKMGFVSTGGGAMLAFLAGETLPGLVVIGL